MVILLKILCILGNLYGDGHGVPEDHKEAVKGYRLAAELGNDEALDKWW